jgi:hypothetical protein
MSCMWWPQSTYGRLSPIGFVTLTVFVLYTLFMSHGQSGPSSVDQVEQASAIGTQLTGSQLVADSGSGLVSGTVQTALCTPAATAETEYDCTVQLQGQPGALSISVLSDSQGNWHQLCEAGEIQAGRVCVAGGG